MARRRSKNQKQASEPNNYQDSAMIREEEKGYRKGKLSKRKMDRRQGSTGTIFNVPKDNDASWYTPSAQLVKDVANLSFSHASGYPIRPGFTNSVGNTFLVPDPTFPTPGIMNIRLMHTFGRAKDPIAPINQGGYSLFAYLRRATSGSSVYQAVDSTIHVYAVVECFALHAWLTRAYAVMKNWSVMDKYTPIALIRAMGFDYSELSNNLNDFRGMINQLGYRLQSLCIPSDLGALKRRIWAYSNIYKDAENRKSQYYMFNPVGFYYFVEDQGKPGSLQFKNLQSYKDEDEPWLSLGDIANLIETLVNPILGSSSTNFIAGDILKAFGAESLAKVASLTEDYSINPIYSEEVMMQIENAHIYSRGALASWTGSLTQNLSNLATGSFLVSDYTYVEPQMVTTTDMGNSSVPKAVMARSSYLLNFHKDNVTPDDVLVATRLAALGVIVRSVDSTAPGNGFYNVGYEIGDCGLDVAAQGEIWYYRYSSGYGSTLLLDNAAFRSNSDIVLSDTASGSTVSALWDAEVSLDSLMATFDWHPNIYHDSVVMTNGEPVYNPRGSFIDLDNFTQIDENILASINKVALMGSMEQQGMGSYTAK